MPRLKVFCTTSGFHDAVVATTSRPAALKAWGAKTDLFSMGVAREVTDEKLRKKALERPGEVIKLDRSGKVEGPAPRKKAKRTAKPPSRAQLKSAEEGLAALEARHSERVDTIDREIRALEKKREQLGQRHSKARRAAEDKVERAREAYEAALADWEG